MDLTDILLIISLIITLFLLIRLLFLYKNKKTVNSTISGNIIQKITLTLFFNKEGILETTSTDIDNEKVLFSSLKQGQNINTYTRIKNVTKYFDSCINHKKNISLKIIENDSDDVTLRHDITFAPSLKDKVLTGVFVISQVTIFRNPNKTDNSSKELVKQHNTALKQIGEIEAQKIELEQAFKKSSKHHIMLQKALHQIETQKNDLEKALETINAQNKKLEIANKEIRKSSKMKEIFLANTSHEIRTPLNAILGFTNLLLNTNLDSSQRRYIENIKASGNNLLVVINDILDFSKIESGKLSLEQIEFNFKNLINHTLNTLLVKASEKNIDIKSNISPEVPEMIIGDPVRLNQILINLLGNAIKFTGEKGKIKLTVNVGSSPEDYIKLLFKVEDNGIGIMPDKLDTIFQSFTQGESDIARRYGGTGLGLSIVKQLITMQNGNINVESKVGKGTTFTFYVILKKTDNDVAKLNINQNKNIVSKNADNMHILLVEDNLINQQLAFDTLKSWNSTIKIDLANNGRIALEKTKNNNYNLILMDIQMPEMDGIEATQEIRKLPAPKCNTPIMAMTAHALKTEKENCFKIGMNEYISKPFDPQDLFSKIMKFANKNYYKQKTTISNNKITDMQFKFFNTDNLKKIYGNNNDKIVKIVELCYESIPNEIAEIKEAYENKKWDVLRNKAHALKPKLGYLGMLDCQNNAKNIEYLSQQNEQRDKISSLITNINNSWTDATTEIENFINSNK
jgi:signal transduction histidine kinase/DNA-binding NarL/FixJ family response regulator